MTAGEPPAKVREAPEPSLGTTYMLVLVAEVLVIAALYWLGRHYA